MNISLSPLSPSALANLHHHPLPHRPFQELTEEVLLLLRYALPIIGTHLLENTLMLVNIISVGHLGTNELAAASLANITLNCSSLSLIVGFASALDGLCSQSYTSGGLEASTLISLRTMVILAGLMLPQALILWNISPAFSLLRVEPALARMACQSLRVLVFALPGYAAFEVSKRWLQAQAIIYPPTLILLLVSPLNALLSYFFIWGPEPFKLGFIGPPLATVISFSLMGSASLLYSISLAIEHGCPGCDRRAFKNLSPNFWLGLAGFTTLASEWWFWELIGIACSRIGPPTLAAQSVIVTISTLMYQFSGGASLAAAGRYGNLVGAGCTRRMGHAGWAALGTGLLFGTVTMLVMLLFRHTLAGLFSSQEDVLALVINVLPTVAFIQIPDSISSTLAGVIRGAGRPKVGALINCIGYYVVGLPVGIFLAFSHLQLGIRGLWLGMLVAVTSTAIASAYYVFTRLIPHHQSQQQPPNISLHTSRSQLIKSHQENLHTEITDYGTIDSL